MTLKNFSLQIFNEKFEILKAKVKEQQEAEEVNSHIIRINKTLFIDTQKLKRYMKKTFKFAFSQIGLAGLVVGYVILGALIFMKIESSFEKEYQGKVEKNREDFYENVKVSAEAIFNEYLGKNFHTKYTQYRTEEMTLKDSDVVQDSINIIFSELNKLGNVSRSNNGDSQPGVVYDKPSSNLNKQKCSWCIELDKEKFNRKIKEHLSTLFHENDKIEDKDKPTMLVREDVWNYPNALLYSATVITTIGEFDTISSFKTFKGI